MRDDIVQGVVPKFQKAQLTVPSVQSLLVIIRAEEDEPGDVIVGKVVKARERKSE